MNTCQFADQSGLEVATAVSAIDGLADRTSREVSVQGTPPWSGIAYNRTRGRIPRTGLPANSEGPSPSAARTSRQRTTCLPRIQRTRPRSRSHSRASESLIGINSAARVTPRSAPSATSRRSRSLLLRMLLAMTHCTFVVRPCQHWRPEPGLGQKFDHGLPDGSCSTHFHSLAVSVECMKNGQRPANGEALAWW